MDTLKTFRRGQLKGAVSRGNCCFWSIIFVLRSYYSAFTHSQNSPVEFVTKRISKKFHQGALSVINFGDVLAQFCQASL